MNVIYANFGECPYCGFKVGSECLYKIESFSEEGCIHGHDYELKDTIVQCPECDKRYSVKGTYQVSVKFKKYKIEGQA